MRLLQEAMQAVILEAISKGYSQEKIIKFMETEVFETQVKATQKTLIKLADCEEI